MNTSPYLMESPKEAARLELKTDAEETRRQLETVGLEAGMDALDAGAGTGAVARVMAGVVGQHGSAVAFDASRSRLDYGRQLATEQGIQNVTFRHGDLLDSGFASHSFDFVWSRFVFQYLANPDAVLSELMRTLRPGGKLVVGDVDGLGVFCDGLPPTVENGVKTLLGHISSRFDPHAGRKLFRRFIHAGLTDVQVHLLVHQLYSGTPSQEHIANWQSKFDILQDVGVEALGNARAYDQMVQGYMDFIRDPTTLSYSLLFLVEGVKVDTPQAGR